jgi:hypothetical protein
MIMMALLHMAGLEHAELSSLLQGKYLPFSASPLRLNIFRLFVILSLTQLCRYTPEIFLFSTATFKYKYRALEMVFRLLFNSFIQYGRHQR